jgi:hypothetical protein
MSSPYRRWQQCKIDGYRVRTWISKRTRGAHFSKPKPNNLIHRLWSTGSGSFPDICRRRYALGALTNKKEGKNCVCANQLKMKQTGSTWPTSTILLLGPRGDSELPQRKVPEAIWSILHGIFAFIDMQVIYTMTLGHVGIGMSRLCSMTFRMGSVFLGFCAAFFAFGWLEPHRSIPTRTIPANAFRIISNLGFTFAWRPQRRWKKNFRQQKRALCLLPKWLPDSRYSAFLLCYVYRWVICRPFGVNIFVLTLFSDVEGNIWSRRVLPPCHHWLQPWLISSGWKSNAGTLVCPCGCREGVGWHAFGNFFVPLQQPLDSNDACCRTIDWHQCYRNTPWKYLQRLFEPGPDR